MQHLNARFQHIELYFVGDGKLRLLLEKQARQRGLGQTVKFIGSGDASGYFQRAYLYLHSSLEESFSNVVIEAMASGVPVVAFSVGGIPEVMSSGYNGFLVAEQNVQSYAQCVDSLLADTALYKNMQEACLKTFKEKFHYSVMGKKYLEFYALT